MLIRRLVATLLIVGVALLLALAGALRPINDALGDWRFSRLQREPLGNTVFVDIDSKSLAGVGVWPWPRRIHAELLDRLMALGAANVVFDVDFSAASDPADDQAFAAALQRAGGFATLAVFGQHNDPGAINRPLPAFAANAEAAAVDVPVTSSGVVRNYQGTVQLGDTVYPSAGAVLADVAGNRLPAQFGIDFGIDAGHMPRISVADILAGKIDPQQLSGKQVIVGASAVELRDLFVTPRFGLLPGAMLHQLAAETIEQRRELIDTGPATLAGILLVLAALAALLDARLVRPAWLAGAAGLAIAFELGALALEGGAGMLVRTAALHLGLALLIVRAAVIELAVRRRDQLGARRERDWVQAMLRRVVADNFAGVLIADAEARILLASHSAEELLGADLLGRPLSAVLPEAMSAQLIELLTAPAAQRRSLTGEARLGEQLIEYAFTVSTESDGDDARRVGCLTFQDITERRRAEDRLLFLADHDPLTGAWSRSRLKRQLEERPSTIAVVDLKRLNLINETLGHSEGDQVLKAVVKRLRLAGAEHVARVGGDSFVAILTRPLDAAEAAAFCTRLIEAITAPYSLGPHQALVGVSIGVTTSAISGTDPEILLSHAAVAEERAKAVVGNSFSLFAPEMEKAADTKRRIEIELRQGIETGEIFVAYQPQISLATGRIVGAEALVRWRRPDGSFVSPADFIPVAEETGLICDLGEWVMRRACADAALWPEGIKLAVNVSPVQFELSDVKAMVASALAAANLPPDRLDIEITEGIFVSQSSPIEGVLRALQQMGIGVALDDFGTGYSSLRYLGQLPVDKIKIDQSFVRNLPDDPASLAIIRAVLLLGDATGKRVIAEGVETEQQAACLRLMNCPIAQGYLFGRPGPASVIADIAHAETRPTNVAV